MYLYSITYSLPAMLGQEWLIWMQTNHIPRIMQTECFMEYHIAELVEPTVEEGMSTFNVQFIAKTHELLQKYQDNFADDIAQAHEQRYQGKFLAFNTILKVLR